MLIILLLFFTKVQCILAYQWDPFNDQTNASFSFITKRGDMKIIYFLFLQVYSLKKMLYESVRKIGKYRFLQTNFICPNLS